MNMNPPHESFFSSGRSAFRFAVGATLALTLCACGDDEGGGSDASVDSGVDSGTALTCAVDNGGCDPLVLCTESGDRIICGACPAGYSGNGLSCTDVNECEVDNGGCDPLVTCTNTVGGRSCGSCGLGYTDTNGDGTQCDDIDECATSNGGCDPTVTCTNMPGGFTCGDCPMGYSGGGATGCIDIDECASDNGGCDPLTTCTNTVGSRTCGACPAGYSGDGESGCVDINECALGTDSCDANATCSNEPGTFSCNCDDGYLGDGTSCSAAEDCGQILAADPTATDGTYTIRPSGAGSALTVYCSMSMNQGGWTQVYDQDVTMRPGYRNTGAWGAVNPTMPNSGQYSILAFLSSFERSDGRYEFLYDFPDGPTQAGFTQWTQDANPFDVADGRRANIVGVSMSPPNQRGCQPFSGLAVSSNNSTLFDGDDGGCWWFAVGASRGHTDGSNTGIPVFNTPNDPLSNSANRARLWVRKTVPYRSCAEILAADPAATDGVYTIDPDGDGGEAPFPVHCDMTTDGGGWTIVYSATGSGGEESMVSDTPVWTLDPTARPFNLTRAQKMAISATASDSIFLRGTGEWLKADAPLFDGNLDTPDTDIQIPVMVQADDGTMASAYMGYSNYNINRGGDYFVGLDGGATCSGSTTNGVDKHSVAYWMLNCGCIYHYLYSYQTSGGMAAGYDVNTALGSWGSTSACHSADGGTMSFVAAMR